MGTINYCPHATILLYTPSSSESLKGATHMHTTKIHKHTHPHTPQSIWDFRGLSYILGYLFLSSSSIGMYVMLVCVYWALDIGPLSSACRDHPHPLPPTPACRRNVFSWVNTIFGNIVLTHGFLFFFFCVCGVCVFFGGVLLLLAASGSLNTNITNILY